MPRPLSKKLHPEARRLREARNRKGWTQLQLATEVQRATRIPLSDDTIKKYESGAREPSSKTIALVEAALGLDGPACTLDNEDGVLIRSIWMDDCDSDDMLESIESGLRKGFMSHQYRPYLLSPHWYQMYIESSETGFQRDIINSRGKLFHGLRQLIAKQAGEAMNINIISLTEAYDWPEVGVANYLAKVFDDKEISVVFISNSNLVLNTARQQMMNSAILCERVRAITIQGQYRTIFNYRTTLEFGIKRINVIMMLSIMINYADEVNLFRSVSGFAQPGDFLLFDIVLPFAEVDCDRDLRDGDPRLNGYFQKLVDDHYVYSLVRGIVNYIKADSVISCRTDYHMPNRGKTTAEYVVSHYVSMAFPHGENEICDITFLRHNPKRLAIVLERLRWRCVETWISGDDIEPKYPMMLMLFQRF